MVYSFPNINTIESYISIDGVLFISINLEISTISTLKKTIQMFTSLPYQKILYWLVCSAIGLLSMAAHAECYSNSITDASGNAIETQLNNFARRIAVPSGATNGTIVTSVTFTFVGRCRIPDLSVGAIKTSRLQFWLGRLPNGPIYKNGLSTGLSVSYTSSSNNVAVDGACSFGAPITSGSPNSDYFYQGNSNGQGTNYFIGECTIRYSITYTFRRNAEAIATQVFPTSGYTWLGSYQYLDQQGNWSTLTYPYETAKLIEGKIGSSLTTCVLDMGSAAETSSGTKNINLGTIPTSSAIGVAGQVFGTPKTAIFSVKNKEGTPCTFDSSNSFWDIRLNLLTSQFVSAGGKTMLISGSNNTNAAANVGVLLKSSVGPGVSVGQTEISLSGASSNTYGVLLSGSSTSPMVKPTENIALTAQFAKTSDSAVTAGMFSTTLTLDVFYK